MKKLIVFSLFIVLQSLWAFQCNAQCSMCRVAVENNVNNSSDNGMASSLNSGILYLFIAPYILIGVVGFLWYRNGKKAINGKVRSQGTFRR
jgi:hypothetical protein